MIIENILSKFNFIEGEIMMECNGMDAIIMEIDKDTSFSCKSNHFDMLSAINAKLERSPIQCNWRHFKGHQDGEFGSLDRRSILNEECDTDAKQRWDQDQDNHR